MTRNTLIAIIGGFIAVAVLAGFVYFLRARNISSLLPAPTLQQTQSAQQQAAEEKKAKAVPVGSTREAPQGAEPDIVKLNRILDSKYTDEELKNLAETSYAEANLPDDLTKTWTPEYRAQVEAQQASKK